MFEILPGILEKDWKEIERKLEIYRPFAKRIHVDFLDGKFAPNATFLDPAPFAKYAQDFILEAHMMLDDPINYLKPFASAGFQRFIGHVEKMPDQVDFVAAAELLGEVGLGIDADTPLDAIKVSLEDLDTILIMTVKAGFSGQQFMEQNLDKVKQLIEKTTIPIEVDGGVNESTIKVGCAAGVSRFVATSFLFGAETPEKQYQLLKESTRPFETTLS
jgi:ribulose-phosphate 3-epimerase